MMIAIDDADESEPNTNASDPRSSSTLIDSQLRILTLDAGVIGDRLVGQVQEFNFSDAPP